MILLFSRHGEPSIMRVAKRLQKLAHPFRLVFEQDVYKNAGELICITENETSIFGIPLQNIKAMYFRKWNANAMTNRLPQTPKNVHALSEYRFVFDFVGLLPNVRKLGFYNMAMHNKMYQQQAAKLYGLAIPKNKVCNHSLPEDSADWLSKPINRSYITATEYGNHETVLLPKIVPENFGLAYLQNRIIKSLEIRSLYFDGKVFSIAYQIAKEDAPDRRYTKAPRSIVPFILPENIRQKLHNVMQHLGGNYSLIDMVYAENENQFYFLEANPFGQYDDLIKFGGYDIDGAIVDFLIQKSSNG